MVQGATYTLTVKPAVSLGIVREIVFTVTDHGSVKATKTYPAEAYLTDEGNIAVPLTQEDTADLNGVTWLEAQYIFTDGAVGKTVRKMLFFRKSAYTKMASAEDGETDAENTGVFALDMEDPVVVVVKTVEGGGSYTLPVANETTLGGVQPVNATADMTQDVGVDEYGRLRTKPASVSGDEVTAAVEDALAKAKESGDFDGENGATFTPSVSEDGTLSWSNDKGLDNPESVNIRGEKGDKGDTYTLTDADKETIAGMVDVPKVFSWANAELPFAADRISDTASGAGFVTNPANFEDGKTYFRYHAGSTSFTWTNPNPQVGAVTITVLAWNQYSPTNTFASRLNIIYSDGTTMVFALTGGTVSTYTTDASKTLTAIKGNYDLENWVLLDMSVMSIVADYDAPYVTKTEFESALGSYIEDIDVLIGGDA